MELKKWICLWGLVFALFSLGGCSLNTDTKEKGEPLEFTVLSQEEIPKELEEILETKKQEEMMMSYQLDGWLYFVRGYGKQESGGYSIAVNGVFLSGDQIHVDTTLIGPSTESEKSKEPSYPYVVIKTEYMEKQAIFD